MNKEKEKKVGGKKGSRGREKTGVPAPLEKRVPPRVEVLGKNAPLLLKGHCQFLVVKYFFAAGSFYSSRHRRGRRARAKKAFMLRQHQQTVARL